jgi:hypothetical protein
MAPRYRRIRGGLGGHRRLAVRVGVVGAAMFLLACVRPGASDGSAPVVDPAVRHHVSQGSVRVLVELRVTEAAQPEGGLSAPEVTRRRAAIAAAQSTVEQRLAGTRFTVHRRYETVPILAMEIGADALRALERMSDLVSRVHEDAEATPSPGPSR